MHSTNLICNGFGLVWVEFFLGFDIRLTSFQSYHDLEAGNTQYLKLKWRDLVICDGYTDPRLKLVNNHILLAIYIHTWLLALVANTLIKSLKPGRSCVKKGVRFQSINGHNTCKVCRT